MFFSIGKNVMSSDDIELLIAQAKLLMLSGEHEKITSIVIDINHYAQHLSRERSTLYKGVELFEKSLQIQPGNEITLSKYASALAATEQYEKAIQCFEQSLQLQPNNAITLSRYANVLATTEQYEKAIQYFERSLQLKPDDAITLSMYANLLASTEQYKKATQCFERSLQLQPNNAITLNLYASSLASIEKYVEAIQYFERSLQIKPNDSRTLSRYANSLAATEQHEKAIQYFDRSLQIKSDDPITLSMYANSLAATEQHEKAIQCLEKSLQLNPDDAITLSRYTNVLVATEQYEKAIQYFERSLQLKPDNPVTLSRYAGVLASTEQYEEAIQYFKQSLQLNPNDAITLSRYASALASTEQYEEAIPYFKQSLQLNPNGVITLNQYAESLISLGRYREALGLMKRSLDGKLDSSITLCRYADILVLIGQCDEAVEFYKKSLLLEPNDLKTLTRYGKVLITTGANSDALQIYEKLALLRPESIYILGQYGILLNKLGDYKKAGVFLSLSLQIKSDNYILFQYARALEGGKYYQEAIDQLENIKLDHLTEYQANVIRLNLGRLYYRINLNERGYEYFQQAINNSDDKEKTLLHSARSILTNNSGNEVAVEMLQKIAKDSPRYAEALEMLTIHSNEEDYFELTKSDTQSGFSNTEMLNRSMYHKIANEIVILKGISYRILRRSEIKYPLLSEIIKDVDDIFEEVEKRRLVQKSEMETISKDNYKEMLTIVAKTAHDISDFVNNQIATIESKTRRVMSKLEPANMHYAQLKELLKQLELTQTALNDLKAINEGIAIKRNRFKVKEIFEKWQAIPCIGQANLVLDIQNGDSEINSDKEKVKSALNELIENSLKHNLSQKDLTIHIMSEDVLNPLGIRGRTIPGEQKYLCIRFSDNGCGVADDKKDWIFQPLQTTSQEGKGSGLGLFIIRKTLTKMNGCIRETGINGVIFEIYIPYIKMEDF